MEFLYDKLRQRIKEKYRTQDNFAHLLGISRTSLNLKLNNVSEFSQHEIMLSMQLLDVGINEIDRYFFTLKESNEDANA